MGAVEDGVREGGGTKMETKLKVKFLHSIYDVSVNTGMKQSTMDCAKLKHY